MEKSSGILTRLASFKLSTASPRKADQWTGPVQLSRTACSMFLPATAPGVDYPGMFFSRSESNSTVQSDAGNLTDLSRRIAHISSQRSCGCFRLLTNGGGASSAVQFFRCERLSQQSSVSCSRNSSLPVQQRKNG